MLGACNALDIHRVMEVSQVFIGFADAIVLGIVTVLNVGYSPGLIAFELKGHPSHFLSPSKLT